ncbi:hypothetical [Yersinia pestis KIM10+]|uniref:Uncharacterized protein n=1 Tax=Yersinia pestis TaxID=632 RepID=Q8CKB7_YERPE|nr:hypothetical [Yersinia pestis KIM10+]
MLISLAAQGLGVFFQIGGNLVHNGISTFYCVADSNPHDDFASKTLFKQDANVFGQNHHIRRSHVFRGQFIFHPDRPLCFDFALPAFCSSRPFERLGSHVSVGNARWASGDSNDVGHGVFLPIPPSYLNPQGC